MTEKLLITPASLSEASILFRLMAASFPVTPWSENGLRQILAMPETRAWFASIPSKPVGFSIARGIGDEAEILSIAVLPSHRRDHVGRQLLEHMLDALQNTGVRSVFLEVAVDNTAAQALYTAAGFSIVGQRPGYFPRPSGPSVDAWIMRKII